MASEPLVNTRGVNRNQRHRKLEKTLEIISFLPFMGDIIINRCYHLFSVWFLVGSLLIFLVLFQISRGL